MVKMSSVQTTGCKESKRVWQLMGESGGWVHNATVDNPRLVISGPAGGWRNPLLPDCGTSVPQKVTYKFLKTNTNVTGCRQIKPSQFPGDNQEDRFF